MNHRPVPWEEMAGVIFAHFAFFEIRDFPDWPASAQNVTAPAALPTSKRAPEAVRASQKVFFGAFPARINRIE